jgi:hypothetical protein
MTLLLQTDIVRNDRKLRGPETIRLRDARPEDTPRDCVIVADDIQVHAIAIKLGPEIMKLDM